MATYDGGSHTDDNVKKDLLTVLFDYTKQKEKRKSVSSLNEDGFVLVMKESVWTTLFGEHFMMLGEDEEVKSGHEDDDMLFYIKCTPRSSGGQVIVFRKGSNQIPGLGDPHINWEETVYLNLIMHQLEYTLTCAVCARMVNRDMKVIKKESVKIYASPHERRMDNKGEEPSQSYPNLFFMVDTYDQVFESLCVRDEEMVCVELVATHKVNKSRAVIFLGSVGYDALKTVYESKGSLGARIMQKMTLGLLSNDDDHTEFIRMRGPHGKGFAQMAVSLYRPNENEANQRGKQHWCQCGEKESSISSNLSSPCSKCGLQIKKSDYSDSVGSFQWMRTRKKSNLTLSTQLTYVNLHWSRIMKDILEARQSPVFTK